MTRNIWRPVLAVVALVTSMGVAESEPIASAEEQGYEVTASNAKELGYEVRIDVPDGAEPRFKRLYVKFPGTIGVLRYAYSSVIYSKGGKSILSYRPEAFSSSSLLDQKELYILADQDALSCLSFVSVYFGKSDGGDHPPTKYVSVNLASFVFDRPTECKGKVDARNFY